MKNSLNTRVMFIVALLVALGILIMGNSCVFADELIFGDYTYKILEDGTAEITDYTGSDVDLKIPDKIDGYQVTCIGQWAFFKCDNLQSVVIPDGVTAIGEFAFDHCVNLEKVTIPETVNSIGSQAFRTCKNIKSIFIPKNVTFIGEDVFLEAEQLEYIEVSPDNTAYASENGVLFSKDMEQLILYPVQKKDSEYIVPDGVVEIGKDAFYKCENINKLTVPKGVKSIKESAFGGCINLKEIYLPKSILEIEEFSFGACTNLSDVYYEGNIFEWDLINMTNATKEVLETANIHYAEEVVINTQTPSPTETTTATEIPKQDENILGYVDENDTIDAKDALLVLQYAAKLTDLIESQITSADIDKSGNVNATDALYILQYAAKIIDDFDFDNSDDLQLLKNCIIENGNELGKNLYGISYDYVANGESEFDTEIDSMEYNVKKDIIQYSHSVSGADFSDYAEYNITINKKGKIEVECSFKVETQRGLENIRESVEFDLTDYSLNKKFMDEFNTNELAQKYNHMDEDGWIEGVVQKINAHVHLALQEFGEYMKKIANVGLSDIFINYMYSDALMEKHLSPFYGYSEEIDNNLDLIINYLLENGYHDGKLKYIEEPLVTGASWLYDIDEYEAGIYYDTESKDLYFELYIHHDPVGYDVVVNMHIMPDRTSKFVVKICETNQAGELEFKQQLETTLESRNVLYGNQYEFISVYPASMEISDEYIELASYDIYMIADVCDMLLGSSGIGRLKLGLEDLGFRYHMR